MNTSATNSQASIFAHIKSGLIRGLCADGILTPAQRDELLRMQRAKTQT